MAATPADTAAVTGARPQGRFRNEERPTSTHISIIPVPSAESAVLPVTAARNSARCLLLKQLQCKLGYHWTPGRQEAWIQAVLRLQPNRYRTRSAQKGKTNCVHVCVRVCMCARCASVGGGEEVVMLTVLRTTITKMMTHRSRR